MEWIIVGLVLAVFISFAIGVEIGTKRGMELQRFIDWHSGINPNRFLRMDDVWLDREKLHDK